MATHATKEGHASFVVDKVRGILKDPFSDYALSEMQRRCANLAARGYRIHEIGDELGIAKGTAATHLREVKAKTALGTAGLTRLLFDRIEKVLK